MLTIKLIQVGIMNKMQKSGEEINPHRFKFNTILEILTHAKP